MNSFRINSRQLIATVLVGGYFFSCASQPTFGHFVDNIDLVIHEAGHVLMIFFGQFIQILGGSLFQVLIPSLFVGYFYFRREYFSASLLLFWVGYNVTNISVYMADAVSTDLPLLGGEGTVHDWNYLLTAMGVLDYTRDLSAMTYGLGMIVMIVAAGLCVRQSYARKANLRAAVSN